MITENTVSSDEVEIDAPVGLVWEVLVDFANYGSWNGFCPSCEATLELGAPVTMQLDLGFGPMEQIEYMRRIEPGVALAWGMKNEPGDPIHALRTQYLNPLGEERCSYLSVDEFSGEATPQMMELMAEAVERGFNQCAYDLKAHCEQLYLATPEAPGAP
jgi:uncharacterized protein YndB with AHSA1/START domain